jgi:hypothetical protein
MKIVNCTSRSVTIISQSGRTVLPPSGLEARVARRSSFAIEKDGVDFYAIGAPVALWLDQGEEVSPPAFSPGTIYVVPSGFLAVSPRGDFFEPFFSTDAPSEVIGLSQ